MELSEEYANETNNILKLTELKFFHFPHRLLLYKYLTDN